MPIFSKDRLKARQAREEKTAKRSPFDMEGDYTHSAEKPLVLIVDDEIDNLKALDLLLGKDFTLILATGGPEALNLMRRMRHPDELAVIISDQRMPEINGVTLLEEAQTLTPYAVRILLTAYTDVDDAIASINRADIYRYLVKPLDEQDLKLTVQRAAEAYMMKRSLDRCIVDLDEAVSQKAESKTEEDVKRLQASLLELKRASMTDPLTGLLNRRGLEHALDHNPDFQAVASRLATRLSQAHNVHSHDAAHDAAHDLGDQSGDGIGFAFLLCDIDYFKQINTQYGHLIGDHVLEEIAQTLRHCFRAEDHLVRWGGEEFLAVARIHEEGEGARISERLRAAIEDNEILLKDGRSLNCTASIGYACFPISPCLAPNSGSSASGNDWKQVVQLADECLFAAKHSGRNNWVGLEAGDPPASEMPRDQNQPEPISTGLHEWLQHGLLQPTTSLTKPDTINWRHS